MQNYFTVGLAYIQANDVPPPKVDKIAKRYFQRYHDQELETPDGVWEYDFHSINQDFDQKVSSQRTAVILNKIINGLDGIH